jgi:hypothetical protein
MDMDMDMDMDIQMRIGYPWISKGSLEDIKKHLREQPLI